MCKTKNSITSCKLLHGLPAATFGGRHLAGEARTLLLALPMPQKVNPETQTMCYITCITSKLDSHILHNGDKQFKHLRSYFTLDLFSKVLKEPDKTRGKNRKYSFKSVL